jgi:hypothetical protein
MRLGAVFVLAAMALLAANIRLYLKDGGYQIVREYKVVEDRVRYYSIERSEWEEIPLGLVDLKRTEEDLKDREESIQADRKAIEEEEKAEREAGREAYRVPVDTGVYWAAGDLKVVPLKQAETKVATDKGRSILKAITPIPIVTGKARVEIDGANSQFIVDQQRPEFYIRLAAEERFGMVKISLQKGNRVVQRWTKLPVVNEIVEEHQDVQVFRKQVADGLYKIWPEKPLEPGEYAVIEYTEGKGNVQVWDFSYRRLQ